MDAKYFPFYLLVIAVFLLVISPQMLAEGMFMDGLLYATVAQNLANGLGSFWYPHLTETLHPVFHEHPPLAFGLQSIFFSLLGESLLVERIYSLSTFAICGVLMVQLWRQIVTDHPLRSAWWPLFLWLLTPVVFWAAPNNMLENTMMVFTTASVLFIVKSLRTHRFLYLSLAGLCLAGAFLTKGFVGLFPLSLTFWVMLFKKGVGFKRFMIDTAALVSATMLVFAVLFWTMPESLDSLEKYISQQVVGSISNVQTVDSRFHILGRLVSELIPAFVLTLLMVLFHRKTKGKSSYLPWVYVLLALGLSGVVPMMVSLKQRGFYILATFPIFSLALALLVVPHLRQFLARFTFHKSRGFVFFRIFSISLLALALSLLIYHSGKVGRDQTEVHDVREVTRLIPKGGVISIAPALVDDWSLHGYFGRYGNISLEAHVPFEHPYLLVPADNDMAIPEEYRRTETSLRRYYLYKRE